MRPKAAEIRTTPSTSLRIPEQARAIIDRAAAIRGKNRSEFMIEAALVAAEDTLLDQTLIKVDRAAYNHFLKALDQPPDAEGFARLMNAPTPWSA
jgi:uncharacterized protein (DUF1778 family)